MYIETIPNRSSPPAILLRESSRIGKKTYKRTVANLSHWPSAKIQALRRVLREEPLGGDPAAVVVAASLPHGHVKAVLGTLHTLGLESLIAAKRCRQRDLVVAMIVARILFPGSKLDTVARWDQCTLASELGVGDATESELYAALDWLLARQETVENKLAARHLGPGCNVLYDLSSSFYYGSHCPLAAFGHDRDKKGLMIIVYGVLANAQGCPVAAQVYAGNTADPRTVADQAGKVRTRFGLEHAVMVGDRGCITQAQIQCLREHPGLGWIGALRSTAIKKLVEQKAIQPSLFDRQNLAEIASADYPGERLLACFNPLLAEERRRKRQELLAATELRLEKIAGAAARRTKTPLTVAQIGVRVGRVIDRFKMAKHFDVTIGEGTLRYQRRQQQIDEEQLLDGIYVVRTSEPAARLSAADAVRDYKSLAHVERAFRCLKGVDLLVRPIYLRTDAHVKAHIFLCLLAYYVEWHMRRALAPLLYADEELDTLRRVRDPVLPAADSESAKAKKSRHQTADGLPVMRWTSLLGEMHTLCRNTCRMKDDADGPSFVLETQPTPLQRRVFELLAAGVCPVRGQ